MLIPYEWRFNENRDVIEFVTATGCYYEIKTLLVGEVYFPNFPALKSKSYEFCFDITSHRQKFPHDKRIALTIVTIIKEILLKGAVIIFVCDSTDKRQKSRHTLFSKWFQQFGKGFEKYDVGIEDDMTTYYVSLLFDPKQHDRAILKIFKASIDEYVIYKELT